jgi:uncharacterized membrane protein (DUF373 family)
MPPTPSGEEPRLPVSERVAAFIKGFERAVAFALLVLLVVVVSLATAELAGLVFRDLRLATTTLLESEQMLELFGSFLLVLVGMELLTSLKEYVRHGAVRAEVVLEVALIALAQKVIILNPRADPLDQFGLAALIVALAGAFWWVRTARRRRTVPPRGG